MKCAGTNVETLLMLRLSFTRPLHCGNPTERSRTGLDSFSTRYIFFTGWCSTRYFFYILYWLVTCLTRLLVCHALYMIRCLCCSHIFAAQEPPPSQPRRWRVPEEAGYQVAFYNIFVTNRGSAASYEYLQGVPRLCAVA